MKNLGIILLSIFLVLVAFHILILKPEKYESVDIYDSIIERGYLKVGSKYYYGAYSKVVHKKGKKAKKTKKKA